MAILADLHVHSAASHDGKDTLASLAAQAKTCGLQAIAVCDHDVCTATEQSDDILFIPAVEISTQEGHILGLFIQRPVDDSVLNNDPMPSAADAIDAIHACGGIAVLAHPFAPQKCDENTLLALKVDAVEAVNARAALHKGANERASALAKAKNCPVCGGSDAHERGELGGGYTRFETDELSLTALQEALLSGRCEGVLVRPCRWRYKGFARVRRDRNWHRTGIKTYAYLLASLLRGLLQR
ncbi:MAG: PHP domain-containing protein [Oscillospiraceae bacterium]|nr:PHP domain-containing protein [Oscillospiraceae bacterium]